MKLQFDPDQAFQRDAVDAVAGLFAGAARRGGQTRGELGIGNRLGLDDDALRRNTRSIQLRNAIAAPADAPLEAWELDDPATGGSRSCPHFSVEMETGTGKTYVYLRTIFELAKRYGFTKFVIVVPSVAVREGVRKNLDITADHFRALYDGLPPRPFVYDAKRLERLREFATASTIQIAIINIDAFRKDLNVIYRENDLLSGHAPIEFIQAARPIVIIDEPQSVDGTQKSREALHAINPLCTLRYSATHRNPYNLVYRLDPVRAFELGLVKQIVVASALAEGGGTDAFVRVEAIEYAPAIRAKLRIDVHAADGPQRRTLWVRKGADLFTLSKHRAAYRDGFAIAEIDARPGAECIRFTSGQTLRAGDEIGGLRDELWRTQINRTLRAHLDRELRLQARGIKVLSLFFVDRVAHYREYDAEGKACAGPLARAFEAELAALAAEPRYAALDALRRPPGELHDGYFASDKARRFKDTSGTTQADDDAYALIMRDKERLLSLDEPLRFIFSHSALREGWDNPNVFQICTLGAGRSTIRKRQEIGRGLRLPVDADGRRVIDPSVNSLYVMANESYDEFARQLQREYEDECGVTFGNRLARYVRREHDAGTNGHDEGVTPAPEFTALWERIKARTTYRVEFSTPGLIARAAHAVATMAPIEAPAIVVTSGRLVPTQAGIETSALAPAEEDTTGAHGGLPDLVAYVEAATDLTRSTIRRILEESGRLGDFSLNPQRFMDAVTAIVKGELRRLLGDGIKYERIDTQTASAAWEQTLCTTAEFAAARARGASFVALPRWFTIATPLGDYAPDWALADGEALYFGRNRPLSP